MGYGHKVRMYVGFLALVLFFAGCGDDEPGGLDNGNDGNNGNDDNGNSTEITDENACELACERVYASTSDGGCQQVFRDDENSPMTEAECVVACEDEDMMMEGAKCVADEDEVDCKSQADEMISACLADDFHVPACEHLGPWDHQAVQFEREVVEVVNEVRAEGVTCTGTGAQMPSVGPVEMDPYLQCAARLHTLDMYERNTLAHILDGKDPTDRANEVGYQGWVTENIAMGYPTPEDVVAGWLSSTQGHCENLMDGNHTDIGVGYHNSWWTQKFG